MYFCLLDMDSIQYVLYVFLLCTHASSEGAVPSQNNGRSLPVTHPATALEGGADESCPPEEQLEMARAAFGQELSNIIRNEILCPGQLQENPADSCLQISQCNSHLPSNYYWITNNGTTVQVYCDMTRECSCNGTTFGGWSRVAYLDMRDPMQQCPPAWREITDPVRTCGRTNESVPTPGTQFSGGCSSAYFSAYGISYSSVCGRIIGYQFGSPDAFAPYARSRFTRIEDPYVDGVVISHGTEKQHIWTFVAELTEERSSDNVCPCTNAPQTPVNIPPFVGEDYFCETAIDTDFEFVFYPNDPLWDGMNCGAVSTCCEFNDPPYFYKSLSESTTDDIEVRICADEFTSLEDSPIALIEIFVQ